MSKLFAGLDMKTYSNYSDLIYGLRDCCITSKEDEFAEGRVLAALHQCSDRIDRAGTLPGTTVLLTCRSKKNANDQIYLEVRVSNSHSPDKYVCLNIVMEDDTLVVRENVIDTTLGLPEFMGHIKDLHQSEAYVLVKAHASKFNAISMRFFEAINKELANDELSNQIRVSVSDTAAGCFVSWGVDNIVVFATTMQRLVTDSRAKVPLTFGSKKK